VHWSRQISVFMKYWKSILFFPPLTWGAVSDTFLALERMYTFMADLLS